MPVAGLHEPPDSRAAVGTDVPIRPLRKEDRDPLRELLNGTEMFSGEEVGIALELIDIVLERPDQLDYIIYCHDDGGGPAGYYCIGPTPATDGTFDLYWIAVRRGVQGRGIGGVLNAHAEQLVRSLGGRLLIAETSSQPKYEPTRMFYLRHGYAETARIPHYYRQGDDLVVYAKYLIQ
jgi:GNAT superfamily N-acetyltransferase